MRKFKTALLAGAIGLLGAGAEAGLVAEWNFDNQTLENSGTTAGEHDGYTVNAPVYTTDTPSGSGYALDLSAVSEFLTITNSSTNFTGYVDTFDAVTSFTVSMWGKSPSGSWSSWEEVAGKGSEADSTGWALRAKNFVDTTKGGLKAQFYGGGEVKDEVPYNSINDGMWHLMTFTYDASVGEFILYIDGAEEASLSGAAAMSPAIGSALVFDAREGDTSRAGELMYDDIRFYDSVLTSNEVASMYIDQITVQADVSELDLQLASPETVVTGSVAVSYAASDESTSIEVAASISGESHPGSFSIASGAAFTLLDPSPSNGVIDVAFDYTGTELNSGEISTCDLLLEWNAVGDSQVHTQLVAVSVEYLVPVAFEGLLQLDFEPADRGDTTSEGGTVWNGVQPGDRGADLVETFVQNNLLDSLGAVTPVGIVMEWSADAAFSRCWDEQPGDRDGDNVGVRGDTGEYNTSTITGLNAGKEYHVTVWAPNECDYRVNNGDVAVVYGVANTSVTNAAESHTFSNVLADASGEIVLDWGHITSSRSYVWASMTAMAIESVADAVVGEISISAVSSDAVALTFETSSGALYGVQAKSLLTDSV